MSKEIRTIVKVHFDKGIFNLPALPAENITRTLERIEGSNIYEVVLCNNFLMFVRFYKNYSEEIVEKTTLDYLQKIDKTLGELSILQIKYRISVELKIFDDEWVKKIHFSEMTRYSGYELVGGNELKNLKNKKNDVIQRKIEFYENLEAEAEKPISNFEFTLFNTDDEFTNREELEIAKYIKAGFHYLRGQLQVAESVKK